MRDTQANVHVKEDELTKWVGGTMEGGSGNGVRCYCAE